MQGLTGLFTPTEETGKQKKTHDEAKDKRKKPGKMETITSDNEFSSGDDETPGSTKQDPASEEETELMLKVMGPKLNAMHQELERKRFKLKRMNIVAIDLHL